MTSIQKLWLVSLGVNIANAIDSLSSKQYGILCINLVCTFISLLGSGVLSNDKG